MFWELITSYWFLAIAVIERGVAGWVTLHAVLFKRDTRSVIGWVGLVWLAPLIGSVLYACFGVNRLNRRGGSVQAALNAAANQLELPLPDSEREQLSEARQMFPHFAQLVDLVRQVTNCPLVPGNRVDVLVNGDEAYPRMLNAIAEAERTVTLTTYIFDNDQAGRKFIDALDRTQRRGVSVRILVDDVGARYSRPTSVSEMQRRKLNCRTFLPTRTPALVQYSNLRSHRKILVVDGNVGFTGGMNIREGCCLEWSSSHPVQDLHFRFAGPVVTQLQQAFATDWAFATGEVLSGAAWFPRISISSERIASHGNDPASTGAPGDDRETAHRHSGTVWARGIADGPDEDFDVLRLAFLGAISVAQNRIAVMTPYFLPDESLVSALSVAAMRGVQVDIVLPERNNIKLVQWASMTLWDRILERGCRIYQTSPPFDHSKLLLVDHAYAVVGSSNWDPRSLRLNFEFNVECYDQSLVRHLSEIVESKISNSKRVTLDQIRDRPWALKLRDGIARLGTPYL